MKIFSRRFRIFPHKTVEVVSIAKGNPMQGYFDALNRGDEEEMKRQLYAYANNCPNRNSNCLSEVFCPECPFGGLDVTSGRPMR